MHGAALHRGGGGGGGGHVGRTTGGQRQHGYRRGVAGGGGGGGYQVKGGAGGGGLTAAGAAAASRAASGSSSSTSTLLGLGGAAAAAARGWLRGSAAVRIHNLAAGTELRLVLDDPPAGDFAAAAAFDKGVDEQQPKISTPQTILKQPHGGDLPITAQGGGGGGIAASSSTGMRLQQEGGGGRVGPGRQRGSVIDGPPSSTAAFLSGTAEIFGTELLPDVEYYLPPSSRLAVFTWGGCLLQLQGRVQQEYTAAHGAMEEVVALGGILDARRRLAALRRSVGPRVLVVGSNCSGKSSLCVVLANYAVRSGWTPVYVELDPRGSTDKPQVQLLPGCIGAVTVESPDYWKEPTCPLVYFYGRAETPTNSSLLGGEGSDGPAGVVSDLAAAAAAAACASQQQHRQPVLLQSSFSAVGGSAATGSEGLVAYPGATPTPAAVATAGTSAVSAVGGAQVRSPSPVSFGEGMGLPFVLFLWLCECLSSSIYLSFVDTLRQKEKGFSKAEGEQEGDVQRLPAASGLIINAPAQSGIDTILRLIYIFGVDLVIVVDNPSLLHALQEQLKYQPPPDAATAELEARRRLFATCEQQQLQRRRRHHARKILRNKFAKQRKETTMETEQEHLQPQRRGVGDDIDDHRDNPVTADISGSFIQQGRRVGRGRQHGGESDYLRRGKRRVDGNERKGLPDTTSFDAERLRSTDEKLFDGQNEEDYPESDGDSVIAEDDNIDTEDEEAEDNEEDEDQEKEEDDDESQFGEKEEEKTLNGRVRSLHGDGGAVAPGVEVVGLRKMEGAVTVDSTRLRQLGRLRVRSYFLGPDSPGAGTSSSGSAGGGGSGNTVKRVPQVLRLRLSELQLVKFELAEEAPLSALPADYVRGRRQSPVTVVPWRGNPLSLLYALLAVPATRDLDMIKYSNVACILRVSAVEEITLPPFPGAIDGDEAAGVPAISYVLDVQCPPLPGGQLPSTYLIVPDDLKTMKIYTD